jgi:integrase
VIRQTTIPAWLSEPENPAHDERHIPSLQLRHGFLDETGAPIDVQQKLMRHANVSTTMNVYGNSSLRANQEANSKVVQMVMKRAAA